MGAARKSYIKFVNLDVNNTEFFGLDIDRQQDESYVNSFDIKHTKMLSERIEKQIKMKLQR